MTISPRQKLVAFDLDDTLAASKSPVPPAMVERLVALLERGDVAVISGGRFEQFSTQLIGRLGIVDEELLGRLHLLPTCGTQYYRRIDGAWRRLYSETLSDDQKRRAVEAVERAARAAGLWEPDVWGDRIEDRESQITFSALGQSAPVEAKAAWDPDGSKRIGLREAVAAALPDLEVRAGGSTSIDITLPGIDKAYGMRKLERESGVPLDEMLFIGDRLDENGNDYPVKALGVRCIAVAGHEETPAIVDAILGR